MQIEIFPKLTADLQRAGFWRRFWSTVFDSLIVYLPFMIVAVLLFNVTAGKVQMTSSVYSYCVSLNQIPASLNPPPPHDPNFARRCEMSLFGAPTAIILTVGRATSDGSSTNTISRRYMLDANGQPVSAFFSLDWVAQLTFLAYLVALTVIRGQTLGDSMLKIRVVDVSEPGVSHVPLRKVIVRYIAMAIGFVPLFGILIYLWIMAGTDPDTITTLAPFRWLPPAGIVAFVWPIIQTILVVMKLDPLYDRIAGTAVVRD